jgi:hypothetical protein
MRDDLRSLNRPVAHSIRTMLGGGGGVRTGVAGRDRVRLANVRWS